MPERLVALLKSRPMCVYCLASNSGLYLDRLDKALAAVRQVHNIRSEARICRACASATIVFWIDGALA